RSYYIAQARISLQSACSKSPKIISFYFFCIGRIAQLVERLSYTQVVIGSSPVAPKDSNAGVVQLVRALPCHGRSCGFKSRLPRISFVVRIPCWFFSFFQKRFLVQGKPCISMLLHQ